MDAYRLPGLDRPKDEKRPPRLRRLSRLPTGPKKYRLGSDPQRIGGPGDPPQGFVGGSTSLSEWIYYWAMAKVLNDPIDPRKPPFFGGVNWAYQKAVLGRYTRQLGSAVLDFIYYAPNEQIGIRIQTARFHEAAGPTKQGYDALQLVALGRRYRIVDVFEDTFIHDVTGQAACVEVKLALGLLQQTNRVLTGTSVARG